MNLKGVNLKNMLTFLQKSHFYHCLEVPTTVPSILIASSYYYAYKNQSAAVSMLLIGYSCTGISMAAHFKNEELGICKIMNNTQLDLLRSKYSILYTGSVALWLHFMKKQKIQSNGIITFLFAVGSVFYNVGINYRYNITHKDYISCTKNLSISYVMGLILGNIFTNFYGLFRHHNKKNPENSGS